jgi:hypothetical protein
MKTIATRTISYFLGITLLAIMTSCDLAKQWGTDMATVPKEYRIDWVESIPMEESRWVVPRLERQGKLFFSGKLKNGESFETLLKSSEKFGRLHIISSDHGPKQVSIVLDGGVLEDRANPSGTVYWFSGEFDKRLLKVMLDSSNNITGVVLLTQ